MKTKGYIQIKKYKNHDIGKDVSDHESMVLHITMDGYPFTTLNGIVFLICKVYKETLKEIPFLSIYTPANIASIIIALSYSKYISRCRVIPTLQKEITPTPFSYFNWDYSYFIEIDEKEWFLKINPDGKKRNIKEWIDICENVKEYIINTYSYNPNKEKVIISKNLYMNSPCLNCIVKPVCITKQSFLNIIYNPCENIINLLHKYITEKRKVIPTDLHKYI